MNDLMIMIPGLAIVGCAVIGMPPKTSSGTWIEYDNGLADNVWAEYPPQPVYTQFKE